MNDDDLFVSNGIDGRTGRPLYPPLTLDEMVQLARGRRLPESEAKEAAGWARRQKEEHLGLRDGYNESDLAQTGWGVLFAHDADPAVREALRPLLDHRRERAASIAGHRYRELTGADSVQPGESKRAFLKRYGVGIDPADPERFPYYLLLVGSPEQIPWSFQHLLGVQYAVGRLAFETPEEYRRYAEGVVRAETGAAGGTGEGARPRRLVLAGTRHDPATELSAEYLVRRLDAVFTGPSAKIPADWSCETLVGEPATKERLLRLLGADAPAVLFTATHGMGFAAGDPLQRPCQGALLTQDWPGATSAIAAPAITPDHWVAAEDLASATGPAGTIAFCYACHGAGTPQQNAYRQRPNEPAEIAPYPFVAALPQRLLGHPNGSALAVVGHVERTWAWSFLGSGGTEQFQPFEDSLRRLLAGVPVGAALDPFALRRGELAAELAEIEKAEDYDEPVDPEDRIRLWTAHNDASGYTILGDPAVRVGG
jgi:hypothetical protein